MFQEELRRQSEEKKRKKEEEQRMEKEKERKLEDKIQREMKELQSKYEEEKHRDLTIGTAPLKDDDGPNVQLFVPKKKPPMKPIHEATVEPVVNLVNAPRANPPQIVAAPNVIAPNFPTQNVPAPNVAAPYAPGPRANPSQIMPTPNVAAPYFPTQNVAAQYAPGPMMVNQHPMGLQPAMMMQPMMQSAGRPSTSKKMFEELLSLKQDLLTNQQMIRNELAMHKQQVMYMPCCEQLHFQRFNIFRVY